MKLKERDVTELQDLNSPLESISQSLIISSLSEEKFIHELEPGKLFFTLYKDIPNCIGLKKIDGENADQWFYDHYKHEIKNVYYNKLFCSKTEDEYKFITYFLYEDLIVYFKMGYGEMVCLFRKTPYQQVKTIITQLSKFKKRKKSNRIFILTSAGKGINTQSLKVKRPKLRLQDNYNDDFKEIHDIIIKRLQTKNDKGLVLLHGKPGTGKTSYIRYLISLVKKKVIFMPPNMASLIANPELMSLLIENPNSILVIEDAENIIIDRERAGYSPVSNLLNIADGLLSDCLNIQVICSFNTDISKVDNALLRKGRLIAKYEFKELEIDKAQALSDKLGYHSIITSAMTLAAIYNQDEREFLQSKRSNVIGFRAVNN